MLDAAVLGLPMRQADSALLAALMVISARFAAAGFYGWAAAWIAAFLDRYLVCK